MISNKGFNQGIITLHIGENPQVGAPVSMSENNTCATSEEGDKFVGVLLSARNNLGAVQVSGYALLPYSGTDPVLGVTEIVADGNGGIKQSEGGKVVTIIGINTAASTVEILM